MLDENVKIAGTLTLVLTDENGNVKERFEKNLVTAVGLAHISSRIVDGTAGVAYNIAIGTVSTAAAIGQTALSGEVARTTSTVSRVTTNQTNDSVQFVSSFGAGVGTGALVEAAIFNAASAGTMLSRTVFSVINKGALDTLSITWKLVIA